MAGFLKGLLRANIANYGDLEGKMTKLKSGRLALTIEKGKLLAWTVGQDDIELSKENVKSFNLTGTNVVIQNLSSGGGKVYHVNIYKIEMKDGTVGTMRLVTATEHKVLELLK